MGKKIVTTIVDDVTGEDIPEAEAIVYEATWRRVTPYPEGTEVTDDMKAELAGQKYDLYLAVSSILKFHEKYRAITEYAEPVALPEPKTPAARKRGDAELQAVRAWWKGLDDRTRTVLNLPLGKDRGRIPEEVTAEYKKAKALNAI